MNVTAVKMAIKLANVKVVYMMQILHAIQKMGKNAVNIFGVKRLKCVSTMK